MLGKAKAWTVGLALIGTFIAAAVAGVHAFLTRTPEYHRDVAPILARHCLECHRRDGVALGLPLDDFPKVRSRAAHVKRAVATRMMPPWGADNTGLCGTWQGARWLSNEEISTIIKWTEGGTPEGRGPSALQAPPAAVAPFRAEATVDLGGVYQPGIGPGAYRCFVADPKLTRDRLLSAIRLRSGDPRGVRQVNLYSLDSDAAESEALRLDTSDTGLGYPCYGTSRAPDSRLIASWTAGSPVLRLSDRGGVRLLAGRKLVVQMHYNILWTGSDYRSSTEVDLELNDEGVESRVLSVAATGVLSPGQRAPRVVARYPIDRKIQLLGVTPRMHSRGKVMQLNIERPGQTGRCLATFDHWAFYDQQFFTAVNPPTLQPGDTIEVSCMFQTLGTHEPAVRFGDTIDDEACVASLLVADQ